MGSANYLADGNNPWSDVPIDPFDRGLTKAGLDASLSTYAISKALDGVNADHFSPTLTAGQLRARLASPDSGFEKQPLAANTDPSAMKAGDIIFGMHQADGKTERFFGVVGEDGKIYSASSGDNKSVGWQGRDLSSFEGFRSLELYRSKDATAAADAAEGAIKGPENAEQALESAQTARDMLAPLLETTAQKIVSDADVDAIRRMGVTEIVVSQGDTTHTLKFGEHNGKPSLSVDDKVLLQDGRLDGRYANSYKFTDLAGATFQVKFVNGDPVVVKLPDDYGKDKGPVKG